MLKQDWLVDATYFIVLQTYSQQDHFGFYAKVKVIFSVILKFLNDSQGTDISNDGVKGKVVFLQKSCGCK